MTGPLVALLVLAGSWLLVAGPGGGRVQRALARRVRPSGSADGSPWPDDRSPDDRWPDGRERGARGAGPVAVAATTAHVAQLAALLRAGLSPASAWRHLADVGGRGPGGAWEAAAAAAAAGRSVAEGLRASLPAAAREDARCARALAAVAASVDLCERTGAPASRVLAGVAGALRDEADAHDARESALAAPRATAKVLLGLPLAGVLLGQVVGAQPLVVLATTAAGRVAAAVGVALALVGWWWSRALVRHAEGSADATVPVSRAGPPASRSAPPGQGRPRRAAVLGGRRRSP